MKKYKSLFKIQKIHRLSVPLCNARRLPRLSCEQREQSIWRFNYGQTASTRYTGI